MTTREQKLIEALRPFVQMERSIAVDLHTAHNRGDAASDWMREDDRDLRKDWREACSHARDILASLSPCPMETSMSNVTEEGIKKLVDRFLSWTLPQSVCSDLCVTDRKYQFPRSGTNLLTADEARQMIEYLLNSPDPIKDDPETARLAAQVEKKACSRSTNPMETPPITTPSTEGDGRLESPCGGASAIFNEAIAAGGTAPPKPEEDELVKRPDWSCGLCGDRDAPEKFRAFGLCYKCAAEKSIAKRNKSIEALQRELAACEGALKNSGHAVDLAYHERDLAKAELASALARADRGLQAANAAQISHGETLKELEHTKAEFAKWKSLCDQEHENNALLERDLASVRERTKEECVALITKMISDWRANKDVQSVLASVAFGIRTPSKPETEKQ